MIPGNISLAQAQPADTMEPIIRWAWNGYDHYSVADALQDIRGNAGRISGDSPAELLSRLQGYISDYGGGQSSRYTGCPVSMTLWVLAVTHPDAANCSSTQLCADAEAMLREIAGPDGMLTPDKLIAYYRAHDPTHPVMLAKDTTQQPPATDMSTPAAPITDTPQVDAKPGRRQEPEPVAEVSASGEYVSYAPGEKPGDPFRITVHARRRKEPLPEGVTRVEWEPGRVTVYGQRPRHTAAAQPDGSGADTQTLNQFARQVSSDEGARAAIATLQAAGVTPPGDNWENVNTTMLIGLMAKNADRFNNPPNPVIAV